MPLDKNLFTLSFVPRDDTDEGSGAIDLVEQNSSQKIYSWIVNKNDRLNLSILDSSTEVKLCTCREESLKLRNVNLLNPSSEVAVKQSGLISWEHSFQFESETYSWRRDMTMSFGADRALSLYMIRKPDPDWKVASYRPGKNAYIEIYDHNLQRVQVDDRKGLELVIIASLLSFITQFHFPLYPTAGSNAGTSTLPTASPPTANSTPALPTNPINKPVPAIPTPSSIPVEPNAIVINSSACISDAMYIDQALSMLQDRSMSFLFVHATTPDGVPRAVKISSEVKLEAYRRRNENLFQYVVPTEQGNTKNKSKPPQSIKVYISRIPLPELGSTPLPAATQPIDMPRPNSSSSPFAHHPSPYDQNLSEPFKQDNRRFKLSKNKLRPPLRENFSARSL